MRGILKLVLFIAEKLSAQLALLAALLSTTVSGTIAERVLGGMALIWRAIAGFVQAYIEDVPLERVLTELDTGLHRGVLALGENLQCDPSEVLAAAGIAFIGYLLLALVLRIIRHHLPKRHRRDEEPPSSKGGHTYEQLYDRPITTQASDDAHA